MVIFAVQNGGWCAAANTLARYRRYGKAGNCKNGKGGAWANNVYRIKKTGKYNLGNINTNKAIGTISSGSYISISDVLIIYNLQFNNLLQT